jgi:hypothetical protein
MRFEREIKICSTIIIIVLSVFLGLYQVMPPDLKKENIAADEFSTERALIHIAEIAKVPHPSGSLENTNVRNYIMKQLKDIGLEAEIQSKTYENIKIENIVSIIKGKNQNSDATMLVAHYDSTSGGSGAADDGAGVASLIETARAIKAGNLPDDDIILLFTDGEEIGLLGARAFVERNNMLLKRIKVVLNFEARGNKDSVVMFETSENNKGLMDIFKASVPYPLAYSFSQDVYKRMPNDTDFTIFKQAGLKGLNFATVNGYESYHKQSDNLENLDRRALQHYGSYALALALKFASLDSASIEKMNSLGNAIYFPVYKSIMIVYSETWVIPLAIFLLLLLISLIAFGVKRKLLSIRGILLCSGIFLVSLLTIAVLTTVLLKILVYYCRLQSVGFTIKNFNYGSTWLSVFMIITLGVELIAYRQVIKKYKPLEFFVGVWGMWSILMVLTCLFFKGISYLFELPVLFACIAIAGILTSLNQKISITKYITFFVLASVPNVILMAPVYYLTYISLTIGSAPILMILFALVIGIIIPIFNSALYKIDNDFSLNVISQQG